MHDWCADSKEQKTRKFILKEEKTHRKLSSDCQAEVFPATTLGSSENPAAAAEENSAALICKSVSNRQFIILVLQILQFE